METSESRDNADGASRASHLALSRTLWLVGVLLAACTVPPPPAAVWIHVRADEPIEAIAESLEAQGIVTSASRFTRLAGWGDRRRVIRSGYYALRPGLANWRVLRMLCTTRPMERRVVILPRMTLAEVAARVNVTLGIPVADIIAVARDSALRRHVATAGETLEGYLYPTTYYVRLPVTARDLVHQMVDTFIARWRPEWDARLDTLDLSRDDAVTLASIIEGEMPLDGDRPFIASVYHNRLALGMRLQADPTVVYALGAHRRLTFDDYAVGSDYNTYTIGGLPPGPIGEPTTESIVAALYPADTDFLYFVGRADGRHLFSRTYTEHLQRVRALRGER